MFQTNGQSNGILVYLLGVFSTKLNSQSDNQNESLENSKAIFNKFQNAILQPWIFRLKQPPHSAVFSVYPSAHQPETDGTLVWIYRANLKEAAPVSATAVGHCSQPGNSQSTLQGPGMLTAAPICSLVQGYPGVLGPLASTIWDETKSTAKVLDSYHAKQSIRELWKAKNPTQTPSPDSLYLPQKSHSVHFEADHETSRMSVIEIYQRLIQYT